ncbi:SOS response-associated peptidase [Chitinophaga arvensicola]|uniref:Abasic site processing protein n=1 Tax=Chitinophaga arvensicola TaxID=29529 RepID=A0A1I0SA60_9BACT|nr:SOS response-associated peptidase family protein [Chitinophaga arvensicola]SEW52064.1 SOS response associated peptidase (SRAP) [Chitinophaga arvensicola]
MCYNISLRVNPELLYQYLPTLNPIPEALLLNTSWHGNADTFPEWPVVLNNNGTGLASFAWGPIPKGLNTPEKVQEERKLYLNAPADKILDPGSWWNTIRHQRCLIPVSGFYGYRQVPSRQNKIAYYIRQKGRELFFIAGLWTLSDTAAGEIPTFSLITRKANALLKELHTGGPDEDRMPLMLTPGIAESWLSPELTDFQLQEILNFSLPSAELEYWPVNTVPSHPDVAEAFYPDLPPLMNK